MNNNGKKLLDKISELDPKLITDADKKPRGAGRMFIGLSAGMATAAAAAIIAVAAGRVPVQDPPIVDSGNSVSSSNTSTSDTVSSNSNTSSDPGPSGQDPYDPPEINEPVKDPPQLDFSKYKDLPKISGTDYGAHAMGGYRTRELYSWELDHSSPWNGAELETMPVYMSSSTELPDLDKMYARMKEVAVAMGLYEETLIIKDNYEDIKSELERNIGPLKEYGASQGVPQEEIDREVNRITRSIMSSVSLEVKSNSNAFTISLGTDYSAYILFNKPLELPEGYNYSADASAREKDEALSYLAEKYKKLTGYSKPMSGHANSQGCYIYEADGDLTQQIVNYWINTTAFHFNKNTGMGVIRVCSDGALEKLADYPILTAAQAEAILKSNKYDDYYRMPSNAKILKTDMVYRNISGSTAVMPYYEFYVESSEKPYYSDEYDLVCEVYTIPAVPEEFIDVDTTDYGAHV